MREPSFLKLNAAEGEFMSNAATGCLSFGAAQSERHMRPTPTAVEHSFGSSLFKRVTQIVRDYLRSGRIIFCGVRKPLVKRSAGYRMLSEGPKMYNSLRH